MDSKIKQKILKILKELYPEVSSELDFENKYQLVVAVSLSAQCTDKRVNQETPALFKKYPDFKSLAAARISSIEKIIRPINYYKTKSKHLKAMATMVINDFGGCLPDNMPDLEKLPGVGHKTASVVMVESGVPAIPVDTHVFRVSNRLGFSNGKNVKEVEEDLKVGFPKKTWRELHHRLIFHGRRVCKARNPLCSECEIVKLCQYQQKTNPQ